jgi:4-amino-4-deoxy-L-arabinose transferase-like glycosyltransferase
LKSVAVEPVADAKTHAVTAPRRVHRAVWAVTALWGALLILYTVLFPTYRGPDENRHVDLIVAVGRDFGYPDFDERNLSQAMVGSMEAIHFGRNSFNLTEEEAPPRSERPRLAGPEAQIPSDFVNQIPQHPPLYYAVMAGVSSFADTLIPGADRWPFDKYVWFLRLLNVLMILPLPGVAYLAARELDVSQSAAIAAAAFPLAIPQLVHIGATVNNDNLLTLLVGVLTVMLVKIAKGKTSRRLAVGAGIVGGLCLLTKGFALFLPAWFAMAYVIGAKRRPRGVVMPAVIALGVMVLIGGWWWIRNLVSFGTVQPGVALLPAAPSGFTPDYVFWAKRFFAWMPIRFWGWFGWFDVRLPLAFPVIASVLTLGGVTVAFLSRRSPRIRFLVLLTPIASIAAMTALASLRGYLGHGDTPAIQGRYLFPGVVGLATVAIWGAWAIARRRHRWLPSGLLGGAAILQGATLATVLPVYWGEPDAGVLQRISALAAWAPWTLSLYAVVLVVLVAFVILFGSWRRSSSASLGHRDGLAR